MVQKVADERLKQNKSSRLMCSFAILWCDTLIIRTWKEV